MSSGRLVTIVRLYLREAGHSTRKQQMEKVMHLLCDQLHVHGVTVLPGMKEAGSNQEPRYEHVGDILRRNPDPPLIIEFFDESPAAAEIRRLLRGLVPDSYAVYWQATWENDTSRGSSVGAAMTHA
jgi:PII-like signaling protein